MADKEAKIAKAAQIVAATGVSANAVAGSGQVGKDRAARIQKAMEDAVSQAAADGLRVNEDAAQIKDLMMAARQKVIDEMNHGAG